MPNHLSPRDLNYILESVSPHWEALKNKRIFITGGTGFFGCWLLESFIWATEELHLNAKITVLTRDIAAFQRKCPHLAHHAAINFHLGDVKNFDFPKEDYAHIIHAATDTRVSDPLETLDTIIQGTRHTLDFATHCGQVNYLLVSSGAVYGKQPAELHHLPEDYLGRPALETAHSSYGIGKCLAEHLCHLYQKQYNVPSKIARCFAFIGPYLPINAHFAVGNFLNDALKGGPIIVNSDGTSYRSYLYAADLTIWLWKILFCGQPLRPYNVGSDEAISIAELAQMIAQHFSPALEVVIKKAATHTIAERYVPNTIRAQVELGLKQTTNLKEAIAATLQWHQSRHCEA